jgi:TAP-like protein
VGILLAGDFSPLLRAELLTAVAAAARADTAPLARLVEVAAHAEGESEEDFDNPLYYATTCEEQDFPWSRAAAPAERLHEAAAAARALGASAFAPFTAANALDLSDIDACAHWPYTTTAPPLDASSPEVDAPLPDVPTLILSGADDLRTPTSNAREVAAMIPDAQLLVVPNTGHSVLGTEPTSCASDALQALFANKPVEQCPATVAPAAGRPPPLPPTSLARVSPAHGYGGLPGRTLHAVALTLADFVRQLLLGQTLSGSLESLTSAPLRVGGLRAGWGELAGDALRLHGYSYVPGVTVSGSITAGSEDLQVGGSSGAHGALRGGAHRSLVGSLGGNPVALPANAGALTAIVGEDAREGLHPGAGGSAARGAARQLAELLGGG